MDFPVSASETTGMRFANIVITATHTHGGPEYYGPLREFLHGRAIKENNAPDFVSSFAEGCAGDVNHVDVNTADLQDSGNYPPVGDIWR